MGESNAKARGGGTPEPRPARCPWGGGDDPRLRAYHDREWGVPTHDDRRHFEFLTLESAQAGLSWAIVLKKREGYERAFSGFDPERVARYDAARVARLTREPTIVRNRRKIEAAVRNAQAFRRVQREFGSFDTYCWGFVGGAPRQNRWRRPEEVPASTPQSDTFSRDLRQRGFGFVGTTIIYAHMQAVGMVNDHLVRCFRHTEVKALAARSSR